MNGESPEQDWFEKADQDGECKVNIRRPEKEECLELRKRLQKARYQVLEDGENWLGIAQAIEAVGNAITKNEKKVGTGLRNVEAELQQFVKKCHPTTGQGQYEAEEGPFESTFENLLEEVRKARNDEAHTGVTARAAARIAVVVGIYLEDTLMAASGAEKDVKAYIQEEVVRTYKWQRLGECRRLMLTHSFSYLPLKIENEWKMLADADLAEYLANIGWKGRKETVEDAIAKVANKLKIKKAAIVELNDSKKKALNKMEGKAAVVINKERDLVGIITPFDLL